MKTRKLGEGYVATTFFLPTHLHQRLKAAAQRLGVPMAEILREAVERRLEELEGGEKEEARKEAVEEKEGV